MIQQAYYAFTFDRLDSLYAAFRSGCKQLIEITDSYSPIEQFEPGYFKAQRLVVSSRSAYRFAIAEEVIREIRIQNPFFDDSLTDTMLTALHEAIANAVMHGNLGVQKSFTSEASMADYYKAVQDALAKPALADLPVVLDFWQEGEEMLFFSVTDSGKGFNYQPYHPTQVANASLDADAPNPLQSHGMGIRLLYSLCDVVEFSKDGRCISLGFKILKHPPEADTLSRGLISAEHRKNAHILIVDDLDYSRHIIKTILLSAGFEHIHEAANGKEALSLVEKHPPSLIITDVMMPYVDGLELCDAIRRKPDMVYVPIIVQTALLDIEERIKAFEHGADDLIGQPIHNKELIARVEMHLQRYFSIQQLREYRVRVEDEIELARQMHLSLLPTKEDLAACQEEQQIYVTQFFDPSSELGGDLWGIKPLSPTRLGFFICDFTGHGVGAAINTFRLQAAMPSLEATYHQPDQFLNALNDALYPLLSINQFATFFYGIIDRESGTLIYSAAGSPKPIHYDSTANRWEQVDSSGVPLGVIANNRYELRQIPFLPNDTILVYSDALIECIAQSGSHLTEAEIGALLLQHAGNPPEKMHKDLIRSLLGQLGLLSGNHCPDDLTIALLTRNA